MIVETNEMEADPISGRFTVNPSRVARLDAASAVATGQRGLVACVRGRVDVFREVLPGQGPRGGYQVRSCPLEHDSATIVAGARPESDDPVAMRHHRQVGVSPPPDLTASALIRELIAPIKALSEAIELLMNEHHGQVSAATADLRAQAG